MGIPKKIYQTCADVRLLRPELLENIEKIKRLNPGWTYTMFDDQAVLAYFDTHLGAHARQVIDRVNKKYGVVLADLFRYLVIYNEGGVYLDVKSTMDKPLDHVLLPDDELVLSQWKNRMGEEFEGYGFHPDLCLPHVPGGEFQQWHVIAAKNHPLLLFVVNQVILNLQHYSPSSFGVGKEGVLRVSGPVCYTRCMASGIGKYRIRFADIQSMGFAYTLYKSLGDPYFHTRLPGHYLGLEEPIVY